MNLYYSMLQSGIEDLGLKSNEHMLNQMLAYLELLNKWNKVYSLTNINDPEQMLHYHLLDGLTIVDQLNPYEQILDVGSGMGVPGVIVAIYYPHKQVILLDSNSKKTAFLNQVKIELNLTNLEVVTSRIEEYQPKAKFPCIIARAFSGVDRFISLCKSLLKDQGVLIAMKSKEVIGEIELIKHQYQYELIPVSIPKVDDQRFLLKLKL